MYMQQMGQFNVHVHMYTHVLFIFMHILHVHM